MYKPKNPQFVILVPGRIVLVPGELRVKVEILFGAKLSSALMTREWVDSQMHLVNMIPDARLAQNLSALSAEFHAVLIDIAGRVEGLQKGLHFDDGLQEMFVETLHETGQFPRDVGDGGFRRFEGGMMSRVRRGDRWRGRRSG